VIPREKPESLRSDYIERFEPTKLEPPSREDTRPKKRIIDEAALAQLEDRIDEALRSGASTTQEIADLQRERLALIYGEDLIGFYESY